MGAMMESNTTDMFQPVSEPTTEVYSVIKDVLLALEEKGYNPANQLVGYLMSGDPTYITSLNNARAKIAGVSRDELVEELVRAYMEHYHIGKDK